MKMFQNVLWKCSSRSLRENKGRTLVTIFGVAMASGLITAVACLIISLLASYEQYLKNTDGDRHATFIGMEAKDLRYIVNNQNIEGVWLTRREGYAEIASARFLEILAVDDDWYEHNTIRLTAGRFPETEHEILLANQVRTNWKRDLSLGDEITLKIGSRYLNGESVALGSKYDKDEEILASGVDKYKIVGFMDDNNDSHYYPGMGNRSYVSRAFVHFDAKELKETIQAGQQMETGSLSDWLYDVSLRYNKKGLRHYEKVNAAILGISEDLYQKVYGRWDYRSASREEKEMAKKVAKDLRLSSDNLGLLELESGQVLNQGTFLFFFPLVIIYMIIIYVGVFCINNSFDLSFTQRVRFYGMMSSVGATKRQRRKMVRIEGMIIASHGIPLGVVGGILLVLALKPFVNGILAGMGNANEFKMLFRVHLGAILLAVLLSAFMVWLSAEESAARAAKLMPIAAIRNNDAVKIEKKRLKTVGVVERFFGAGGKLGLKNFRRSRLKYRACIISIAVSATLFVGMSVAGMIFETWDKLVREDVACQLNVTIQSQDDQHVMEEFQRFKTFAGRPGVTKAEFSIGKEIFIKTKDIPYIQGSFNTPAEIEEEAIRYCLILMLDEESFVELCGKSGIDPKEAKGKLIANAMEVETIRDNINFQAKLYPTGKDFAVFQKGDILQANYRYLDKDKKTVYVPTELEIAGQTQEVALGFGRAHLAGVLTFYTDEEWAKYNPGFLENINYIRGCFFGTDIDALEREIEQADFFDFSSINYDQEFRKVKYTKILVLTLISGFMAVIALIGISNIINAIGTNMELRAQEFASLRSIGMTRKQFRNMLLTEVYFIGMKGLGYGLAFGVGISYALYRFFWEICDKAFTFRFHLPVKEGGICIMFVGVVLALIVWRFLGKLEKKGIMETLRNENL